MINSSFRCKRYLQHLEPLISSCLKEKGSCSIIDVGGVEEYWRNLITDPRVTVTLVNLRSDALTPAKGFVSIVGDGRNLHQFEDMTFDIAHANSVVEHVGRWADMKAFAGELRRLAPAYYVQTPNYWFPVDPHTRAPLIHFLPINIRYYLHRRLKLGWYDRAQDLEQAIGFAEDASMIDRPQMRLLFPDAELIEEKFLGLTKSLVAVRRRRSDLG